MITKASVCHGVFSRTLRLADVSGDSVVFSGGVEGELGYPDIGTLQAFCRLNGMTIVHIGMGCFDARYADGSVIATFFGGGAMNLHTGSNGEYIVASSSVRFAGKGYATLWDNFIADLPGVVRCRSEVAEEALASSMNSELIDGRW